MHKKRFNRFDTKNINLVPLIDIYRPVKRFFNLVLKKQVYEKIKSEIEKVDCVIIRSCNYFLHNNGIGYL